MVDVILSSGLANRMRVIASCMYWQAISNVTFHYYWPCDEGLKATFEDLFEPLPNVPIRPLNRRLKIIMLSQHWPRIFRHLLWRFYRLFLYRHILSDKEIRNLKKEDNIQSLYHILPNQPILLTSCEEFGPNDIYFRYFQPVITIQERIAAIQSTFPPVIYGIHIRQTDQIISIKYSPVSLFMDKMKEILETQPDAHFYLSTDDPTVERRFLDIFGDKIIRIKHKSFERNSLKGMQEAVMDMYLLSKTSKIYGSYWSSYNQAAARISGIPLEVVWEPLK